MTDGAPPHIASGLLASAREAAAQGNTALAETHYRAFLHENAEDPDAQRELGILLTGKKVYPEARTLLEKAIAASPEVYAMLALADCHIGLLAWQEAEAILSRILQALPKFGPAIQRFAGLATLRGEEDKALQLSKLAAKYAPDELEPLTTYASLVSVRNPGEAVAIFRAGEARFAANPGLKAAWAAFLVHLQERAGRKNAGLPSTWCLNSDDIAMRFCLPELRLLAEASEALVADPRHAPRAQTSLGHIAVHRGDIRAAEAHFSAARSHEKSMADAVTFDPQFYAEQDGDSWEDIIRVLPPVIRLVKPERVAGNCFFLACDSQYYVRYAKALIRSINANAPGAGVRLHIMDATADILGDIEALARELPHVAFEVTAETTPCASDPVAAKLYYHAIRFVRLYQALSAQDRTVLVMDVDALVHRDPWPEIAKLPPFDVALRVFPDMLEIWLRFSAAAVVYRPTAAARRYARMMAIFLTRSFRENTLRWGIDQFALYSVYALLREVGAPPGFVPFADTFASLTAAPDAPLWLQAGRGKELVRRFAKSGRSSAGIAQPQYVDALRTYAVDAQ